MEYTIEKLNEFLGKAAISTYAGDGKEVESQRPGFIELEYKDGDFYYRDSYAGFFTSSGQEVVWYQDKPIWTQLYGGGMRSNYQNNEDFAHETFSFLKKVLSHGEKVAAFQPRGEKEFIDGDWKYECDWIGDITDFKGSEKILYKNEIVFTHDFLGGLLKWR
ncbi:MAG: DUF5680 domain-containing protein [Candidatus Azambacteria bacterium]|nr:DUF5680 domain-containing protein [Candidatus Azambacteria bacterium]